MNKIINVHPEDFTATVQPGITYEELNKELKKYNLFFSPVKKRIFFRKTKN